MTPEETDELADIVSDLLIDYKDGNVEYDYAHARIMELILNGGEPASPDQEAL